uniref:ubiquitinyl hydrolase 1 n=1 Tax=Hippocampus comes TaxID=109280 RepID=A0A3Q2XUK2_HIPCM
MKRCHCNLQNVLLLGERTCVLPLRAPPCACGEMDRCKHVVRLRLGHDHSILNPQKWHCVDCSTTDSVWACLKCSHVACGRFMEEHSLKHFQESHHPLAMEVRELDVFCFACGDYVLNDNAEGDLKLLRGALSTLALRHRRKTLLAKMLQRWTSRHKELQAEPHSATRRRLAPGVTGLRNLGNTCYMNSILQVLSHLQKFRECFLTLDLANMPLTSCPLGRTAELVQPKETRCSTRQQMSLCHELHTLFRVMWSGRWSLVSPFAMLHSVWNLIPAFRGYDQQDAQEFLCE